jgi:arylsulfatase A-like enzyme
MEESIISNEHTNEKLNGARHHHDDYDQRIYYLENEIKRIIDSLKEHCDQGKTL